MNAWAYVILIPLQAMDKLYPIVIYSFFKMRSNYFSVYCFYRLLKFYCFDSVPHLRVLIFSRHMGPLKSVKHGSLIKAIRKFTMVRQNYGKDMPLITVFDKCI